MQLELAATVDQVHEGGAAVSTTSTEAAGNAVRGRGFLARLQAVVLGVDVGDRCDAIELVREGVDPLLAQALELRPAIVHGAKAT